MQRRLHRRRGEAGGRAELHPRDHSDDAKQRDRQPRSDCPKVAQPLADVEADDVQRQRQSQAEQRKCHEECGTALQSFPFAAADIKSIAGREVKHRGEIGQVAGPVNPSGQKAGEVAEGALAPDIHAAFLGIARGEFEHAQCQRNEDGRQADQPDHQRARSRAGRNRNPAQAQRGDHVEHHQVAETQDPLGLRRSVRRSRWRTGCSGRLH